MNPLSIILLTYRSYPFQRRRAAAAAGAGAAAGVQSRARAHVRGVRRHVHVAEGAACAQGARARAAHVLGQQDLQPPCHATRHQEGGKT